MNENLLAKIEEYLNGEMSSEEKLRFESEIASNEELSSLLNIYRVIETEMRNTEAYIGNEASLKNSLKELNAAYFGNKHQHEKKSSEGNDENEQKVNPGLLEGAKSPASRQHLSKVKKINVWKSLAVAAGVLGIISLGVMWYYQNLKDDVRLVTTDKKEDSAKKIQNQDTIYPKENIPPENVANNDEPRIPSTSTNNHNKISIAKQKALFDANFRADTVPRMKGGPLQEVYAHYESGEYKDAIEAFKNVNPDMVSRGDSEDKQLTVFYMYYYKGLSYMANNEVQKSIPSMETAISKSPDNFLRAKALWYLSLAYLKTGQIKKAETILQQLTNNEQTAEYKQKATEIIAELRKK